MSLKKQYGNEMPTFFDNASSVTGQAGVNFTGNTTHQVEPGVYSQFASTFIPTAAVLVFFLYLFRLCYKEVQKGREQTTPEILQANYALVP